MDQFLNLLIFGITFYLTLRFFRKNGAWSIQNGLPAFRFFTVQSNVFCAVAALLLCFMPSAAWVWTLKYIGTAAVTVTMLTVFLFLGPQYGYRKMLSGADLFMHLLTPVLAIVSFLTIERRPMPLPTALLGILPVLLYGVLYLYKVVQAPEDRRWEDFYGFNKGGKWPISFTVMTAGALVICTVFFLLQNR